VVFSASQGGELSFEPAVYRREENGFFTAAMLQALSGGSTDTNLDGSISTTELRTFVRRLVSQRTDGRQNPAVDRDNLSADIRLPAGNYDFGSHSQDDLDNALRTAVLNKGTAAVEALLAAGADPNVAYRDQRTVLSVSAAEGDTETALMLLEAGADPRLFDEDRYDGFLHAVKNDHVEIARVLVEEHGMGRDDELISVGVNGVFPLYLAARYAGMEMLDLLLSSGVHLRLTERSPLCAAAERNNTAVLKRLLEAGLDPNIPEGNYFYETPLVRAVRMKKYEAITMLLKAGADPNASGEEDFPGQRLSPIEEAAGIGDARAFRMLLDAGAMVTDSCLDKAVEIGAPEIVELLLAAGVKATNGHFHTAAGLGRLETAKLLVKVGIDPGIIDPAHEANHLVTAAVRGDRELFEWLLSLGVSLNEPPHSGTRPNRPPLHNCLSVLSNTNFIGAEQALRLFISNGADVTVTDGNGRNAYEFAVWLLENNYNEEADDSFLRLLRP
jgi:ankyrin repeat protein